MRGLARRRVEHSTAPCRAPPSLLQRRVRRQLMALDVFGAHAAGLGQRSWTRDAASDVVVERSWKNEGATDGKRSVGCEDVKCLTKPKPLRPVATSRSQRHMVRRGSTVRVRQRALQNPCIAEFSFRLDLHDLQRAVGMEPFMEPSYPKRRS
jgi:hypothetical protein